MSAADDRSWMDRAACRGTDPEAFFPGDGQRGHPGSGHSTVAVRVCAGCPVRERCVDYAIATHTQHGIWGGLDVGQRNRIARKRLEVAA